VPWPHFRPANPEKLVILIGKETRLPIIAALDDVQGNTRQIKTGEMGHGKNRGADSQKTWSVPVCPYFSLLLVQMSENFTLARLRAYSANINSI
jgi:hypothetical protein